MGHTPGPLTYEFVPEDDERDLPRSEWTGLYIGPADETGRILRTIFEGGMTHGEKDGDPEDDARLWTAAPDMYEALIEIRGWREIGRADTLAEKLRAIEEICDEVLSKAKAST